MVSELDSHFKRHKNSIYFKKRNDNHSQEFQMNRNNFFFLRFENKIHWHVRSLMRCKQFWFIDENQNFIKRSGSINKLPVRIAPCNKSESAYIFACNWMSKDEGRWCKWREKMRGATTIRVPVPKTRNSIKVDVFVDQLIKRLHATGNIIVFYVSKK